VTPGRFATIRSLVAHLEGCATMGCLLILMTGFAPRLAAVLYWIWRPGLWDRAFNGSWIWPVLGIVFLPVTTIVWVLVATNGVAGFDFLWLGLAVFIDIGANGRNAAKRDWSSS
jgi:hypothetical protein